MDTGRIIENAVLVEVRDDGAQKFKWGDDSVDDAMWLRFIGCAINPRVGMVGRLVYRKTPTSGLFYFEPYKAMSHNGDKEGE